MSNSKHVGKGLGEKKHIGEKKHKISDGSGSGKGGFGGVKSGSEITDWLKIDNAAKIYAMTLSRKMNNLFRVSVSLKEPVDTETLQKALNTIIQRMPYYQVRLKRGLFWHYLEHTQAIPKVVDDSSVPCRWLPKDIAGNLLFQVRVYDKRIAVEMNHILADGTGALTFLKSLTAEYLIRKGWSIPESVNNDVNTEWDYSRRHILRPGQRIDPEEYEDAYRRVYTQDVPLHDRLKPAYKYRSSKIPSDESPVILAFMPIKELKEKSRALNITMTEYVVAVIIFALQEHFFRLSERERRRYGAPIRISIPVNLRKLFPSKTMRNFSLLLLPGVDVRMGYFSFDEIAKVVHHELRGSLLDRTIVKQMSRNMQGELSPIVRITPLPIKKFMGSYLHRKYGESQFSFNLSNLGEVRLPDSMKDAVERFDFILGPRGSPGSNVSMISYGGTLSLSFRKNQKDPAIARGVCRFLVKQGIPVEVEASLPWKDV